MIHDDELAKMIRDGSVTPDDALQMLKDDKVLVYDVSDLDVNKADWADAEDAGVTTGIHHALAAVNASDMSDQFSTEIQRLRAAGKTMESLWADKPEQP